MSMYHILYETTNVVNGKKYIGVHSTKNYRVFDGYLGSGVALNKAISKYGRDCFRRNTIIVCPNREYAFEMERRYVDEDFVQNRSTYNIRKGGSGKLRTISHRVGYKHSWETRQKISKAHFGKATGNRRPNYKWSSDTRNRNIERVITLGKQQCGAKSPVAKRISISGRCYDTITDASNKLEVARCTIYKWLKTNKFGAKYI